MYTLSYLSQKSEIKFAGKGLVKPSLRYDTVSPNASLAYSNAIPDDITPILELLSTS